MIARHVSETIVYPKRRGTQRMDEYSTRHQQPYTLPALDLIELKLRLALPVLERELRELERARRISDETLRLRMDI